MKICLTKLVLTAIVFIAASGCASASQSMRDVKTTTSAPHEEPLTLESAVQLAFQNNPALKGRIEGLGVSSAEIARARLPRNPVIEGSILYPEHGDGEFTEISVEQNFLSLVLFPMKSQVAGARRHSA